METECNNDTRTSVLPEVENETYVGSHPQNCAPRCMRPEILFGSWKCVDAGRCGATDIDMESERGGRMLGTIDS